MSNFNTVPTSQVNVRSTNSTSTNSLVLNVAQTILLPSTLANATINLQFTLAGVYVTAGITGTMTVSGQYGSGRIQSLTSLDLSSANQYIVIGKYTQIIVQVTALSGADTVIVNVDQNVNMLDVSGATGAGATSILLTSADGSVVAVSPSTYNSTTQALTQYLEVHGASVTGIVPSLSSATNTMSVSINGGTASTATIINTNSNSYDGNNLVTTINGLAASNLEIDGGTIKVTDPTGGSANATLINTALGNLQTEIAAIQMGFTNFDAFAAFTPTSSGIASTLIPATTADTDGVTLTSGNPVFAYSTFDSGGSTIAASAGGIYTFNGYGIALTRSLEMSSWDEIVASRVYIANGGTAYKETNWLNTNQLGGTIGVTAVTYTAGVTTYTIGTIDGNTESGNGASISGSVIYMQSASSSDPGLMNTTTQTIAGAKTFSTPLNVASTTVATQTLTESAGATTVTWSNGTVYQLTLSANLTISFSGAVSGQTIRIILTNTGSNYTVTWPTISWPNGGAPVMSLGAVSDEYEITYNGSTYIGTVKQNIYQATAYSAAFLVVGGGGSGTSQTGSYGVLGTSGTASVLSGIDIATQTAYGGGNGGGNGPGPNSGVSGGSGGGGGGSGSGGTFAGGTGIIGQGNSGGTASGGSQAPAAGGGGAGAAGGNTSGTSGGAGGTGTTWSINSTTYAGGGGGGTGGSGNVGAGGSGGGGGGSKTGAAGTSGTANTGGGGGGATNTGGGGAGGYLSGTGQLTVGTTYNITVGSGGVPAPQLYMGGAGGSGVVIIAWLTAVGATPMTTGSPTVTTSGSYTLYTYTASGTYTA